MFWGLIMEPRKRYTQTVQKAFHLSMASLDASTSGEKLVQVMLVYENRNYLLCSLQRETTWQMPLDLNFEEGSKISFMCNGEGHVHLTGYLLQSDDSSTFDDQDLEEMMPKLVNQKKRKAGSPIEPKAKKNKTLPEDEDDDDSSDDDDDDLEMDDDLDSDMDDDDDEIDDDSDEDEDEAEEDDEDNDEETGEESDEDTAEKKNKVQKKEKQQNKNDKEKFKQMNGKASSQEKGKAGSVDKESKKQKKEKEEKKSSEGQNQQSKKKTIEGGVQIEDTKVGNGPIAKSGKFVTVYYIGRLKNGKKFDATTQGDGFKFRLGKGEVIKGWDLGISGMKVGGKRKLTIPPSMAYGSKGSLPVIPPNSTLNFEVELRAVH